MNEDCIVTNPIDDDACIVMDVLDAINEQHSTQESEESEK